MKANELRQKYFEFFKEKKHKIIPSAPIIPENDPTVLFTTAGMHPLVPFILGQPHPQGKRLANVQKCIRTGDIDEVGNKTHHTFFEMLGNWSFDDYFKKEAIEYSFEFLTKWLNISKEKLAITVFKGDKNAPKDKEAIEIWKSLEIPKGRISALPAKDNWWGPAGKTGPCGPCTEMFYWSSDKPAPKKFNPEDKTWVEIWNDVFMQYNKDMKENFEELKQKTVDTGMGLERTLAVLNNIDDNYKTELFLPIIKELEKISKKKYEQDQDITKSMRIISDHLKAATFILADGIKPSNLDQGYVLRRLIRRSIRHSRVLEIDNLFTKKIAKIIINIYKNFYTELEENKKLILDEIEKEEKRFRETITKGMKQFEKIASKGKKISGKDAFFLFASYGFPFEITKELAHEKNLKINEKEYNKEFIKHQELSRKATEKKFKSGLADTEKQTIKLHTATHLLHKALQELLGDEIQQKGSNITPERLRFDFNFDRKLTPEEIQKVENKVNEMIQRNLKVQRKEMTLEQAKKIGAIGIFAKKYGEKVSVYCIGDYSIEICAGPHVTNTKKLGEFKILKERAVAAGIRRIKAILV